MNLSVVIGTYNRFQQLKRCLDSLIEKISADYEIIVTDAGSTDGTLEYLRDLAQRPESHLRLIEDGKRIGQAKSLNRAFRTITSKYVCWLSDDNVAQSGMLDYALSILEKDNEIGMIGLKVKDILGPLKDREYLGYVWPLGILNINQGMLRTDVLHKVDYFDEQYGAYGIDADLTTKVLLWGYKVVYTKKVAIHHYRDHDNMTGALDETTRIIQRKKMKKIYRQKYYYLSDPSFSLPKKMLRSICLGSEREKKGEKLSLCYNERSFKYKIFYWFIISVLRVIPFKRQFSQYNLLDWEHVFNARFISFLDLWYNRNKPYYLVQFLPKAYHKRTILP